MKKLYIIIVGALLISACGGQNKKEKDAPKLDTAQMMEDAKILADRTAECLSLVDFNDTLAIVSPNPEADSCLIALQELMDQYDQKYSDSVSSVFFGTLYIEALQKTDIPQELKDLYTELGRK